MNVFKYSTEQLHKLVVGVYRVAAVLTLWGVLLMVLSYAFMMGFYAINASWIAPIIVRPTNDKILDLTVKIVTSEQALDALVVDRNRLDGSLGDMRKTTDALRALDRQFKDAIALQKQADATDRPELDTLNKRKQNDNIETQKEVSEITEVEARIDKDLIAGLITKGDAAVAKTQIRQSINAATDGNIAEVLLRDSVRQKTPDHTATVDEFAKEAELNSSLVQLAILVTSGEAQLASDKMQIAQLAEAIATAKDSPYFLATKVGVKFAFVPYDNQGAVFEGASVYDCYLNMVICRKVGVVKKIFKDEEVATHPVFKTEVRGSLIQLELTEEKAAKDKVLFVGHKPLLF